MKFFPAVALLLSSQATAFTLPSTSRSHFRIDSAVRSSTLANNEVSAPAETEEKRVSWDDDGFVFGLDGSGLERPKGRSAQVVLDGDTLETQPYQVAAVSGTFLVHGLFLSSAFQGMLEHNGDVSLTSASALAITIFSWVLADFGSGVLHWSVDNYGNGKTPIFGGIIAAFQGHHSAPWTITEREFANNVYKLCVPFGALPMIALSPFLPPSVVFGLSTFCIWEIMSQEFHKWSHQRKSETSAFANVLMDAGIAIDRKPHALHHVAPYKGNYCIVSGFWNEFLDEAGFFRRLEHMVYNVNGVESNSWKLDPELKERAMGGEYGLK